MNTPRWTRVLACVAGWVLLASGCTGASDGLAEAEASPDDPAGAAAPAQPAAPLQGDALLARGEEVYANRCQTCHGAEGQGDGPAAYLLFPKPRDFTFGSYRIRTTGTGDPPTDADLMRTITEGMPGSGMPAFSHVPEEDRRAVVEYVKSFAPDVFMWQEEARVVEPGEPPEATPDLIVRGREVYNRLECAQCHGPTGAGDGPSAGDQTTTRGLPAYPNDLTAGIFKGGDSVSDIYLRFTTGMSGTPMPSFEYTTSEEERWALAHYVRSLADEELAYETGLSVRAPRVDPGSISTDPLAPVWNEAPSTRVPLMLLWQRSRAPRHVQVQAAHDGDRVAIRLVWEDSGMDGEVVRPQDYADAAAIQLGLTDEPGHITMGEPGKPVAVWHWRFDRQRDVAARHDVEDAYPDMPLPDDYPFEAGSPPRSVDPGEDRPDITPAGSHAPTFITGWGVGNPLSDPHPSSPIQTLWAEGFGTLEALPDDAQGIEGHGDWRAGHWAVTFVRPLSPVGDGEHEVRFRPGRTVPVAFAVWDGGSDDRNGQKSVSMWQELTLED